MMVKHYTYLITNLNPTSAEKYYIGVRSCQCAIDDDVYFGSSEYLNDAIRVHGVKNFEKEILNKWVSRNLADAHEEWLHAYIDVASDRRYYNKKNANARWSSTLESINRQKETKADPEWKKKTGAIVSKGKKGKCLGVNNANYGNKMSANSKAIISKANKGHTRNIGSIRTVEQRVNISNSLKGKRWYNNGETRVYVFPKDKPAGYWPGLKLTKKDKNYE